VQATVCLALVPRGTRAMTVPATVTALSARDARVWATAFDAVGEQASGAWAFGASRPGSGSVTTSTRAPPRCRPQRPCARSSGRPHRSPRPWWRSRRARAFSYASQLPTPATSVRNRRRAQQNEPSAAVPAEQTLGPAPTVSPSRWAEIRPPRECTEFPPKGPVFVFRRKVLGRPASVCVGGTPKHGPDLRVRVVPCRSAGPHGGLWGRNPAEA
jgi:hypothetical protein